MSEEKTSSIFDQRHQTVTYQYNAAGDINLSAVENQVDVLVQMEKLQAELDKAIEAETFDEDTATDSAYQLKKAVQQAKKQTPNKQQIIAHLEQVKKIIGSATKAVVSTSGFVVAIAKVIELVYKYF